MPSVASLTAVFAGDWLPIHDPVLSLATVAALTLLAPFAPCGIDLGQGVGDPAVVHWGGAVAAPLGGSRLHDH